MGLAMILMIPRWGWCWGGSHVCGCVAQRRSRVVLLAAFDDRLDEARFFSISCSWSCTGVSSTSALHISLGTHWCGQVVKLHIPAAVY